MEHQYAYRVTVGETELSAHSDRSGVRVNGTAAAVSDRSLLSRLSGTTADGTEIPITVEPGEEEHEYIVYMHGEAIRVRLTTPRDERLLALRKSTARPGSGGLTLRAPMPGLLKSVLVSEGEIVAKGTSLCILEAMKMENELKAPDRLRVSRITAQSGTAVEKGTPLLELSAVHDEV